MSPDERWIRDTAKREPPPLRGNVFHPDAGYHAYPPPKNRYAVVRKTCGHCGLVANTWTDSCPVCDSWYPAQGGPLKRSANALRRLRRRLRR
jgi:hypothetical protein